jgi:hypothetical protein
MRIGWQQSSPAGFVIDTISFIKTTYIATFGGDEIGIAVALFDTGPIFHCWWF